MKAAVVYEYGAPLVIDDRSEPVPDPGEVVVRVEASGLCHTDLYAVRGDWPVRPALPLVPGHEAVGRVAAVGRGVTHVHEGDRVAVPRLGWACGRCHHCLTGAEALCPQRRNTGYDVDGGWAEMVKASADFVVTAPFGVDALDGACLSCAGLSSYKAVTASGAGSSSLTAVFGIGGLGHLAVQYAAIAGATVAAVDLVDDKLTMAKTLGASYAINASIADPVAEIRQLGGADQAIASAASADAVGQALACLRPGGTLVLVAIPEGPTVALPIYDTVRKGITVIGSIGGNRADLADVFALHADGRTRVVHQARVLSQVNEALADIAADRVAAKLVFEMR